MLPLGLALVSITIVAVGLDLRPVGIVLLWLACITPALVRIDVVRHRLPNRIVLPALALAAPLVVFDAVVLREAFWGPLAVGLGIGAVLYTCAVFGGLGMGDVKLGALLGLAVGCFGASAVLLFATVSIAGAGIAGAAVVFVARLRGGAAGWSTRIPFGPFLLLGCWTAVAATA